MKLKKMLTELDDLEVKIEDFVTENEELTVEIKEDIINLAEKINSNDQDIAEELEEFEEIVNLFNKNVQEIEPSLTENLTNTHRFLDEIILRAISHYQEVIDKESENFVRFYDDYLNNFIEENIAEIPSTLDNIISTITDVNEENKEIIEEATETLITLYSSDSGEISEEYQNLFNLIEEKLIECLNDYQEKIGDRTQEIEEKLEESMEIYKNSNDNAESLIRIFEKLVN